MLDDTLIGAGGDPLLQLTEARSIYIARGVAGSPRR
jgi:hypothetical protein